MKNIITPEIVKNLLNLLVTPNYPDLIHDYMVETVNFDDGFSGIVMGVIVNPEVYYNMDNYTGNPLSGIDSQLEKEIKDVLKYLGPSYVEVNLFVLDDDSDAGND
jgi:hypothetical protein